MAEHTSIDLTPEQKRDVTELLKRYVPNTKVWAYGSRVRWSARPDSDLDMVVFSKPEQQAKVSELREAFAQSNLPFPVDLFVWDQVPETFRQTILQEYSELQGKDLALEKVMGCEWKNVRLDEIVDFNPKRTIKKNTIASYIEMAAVPELSREVAYIFDKEYKGGGCRFKNGDVLFARITPCLQNGKTSRVSILNDKEIAHGSTEFIVLTAKEESDKDFIYYLSRDKGFRSYAESRMEGSTGRQRVSWQSLADYQLTVPTKIERQAIAHILGTLDDKIELNRQMNETLESMAQALFKSWFVDFDPVLDNAITAGNPIPDALAERAELRKQVLAECSHPNPYAEHFPSEFEFTNEMGWIPMGWIESNIGSEVDVYGGGTPSTKNTEFWEGGTISWSSPKDLSGKQSKILLDTDRKITEKGLKKISSGLLPVDTVLMSSRAPVGYLAIAKIPLAINQGYIAMCCEKTLTPEFVIQWTNAVMDEIKQRAGGTTFSEISKRTFREMPVLIPNNIALNNYSSIVKNYYFRITESLRETNQLSQLRDTLLPQLLSGKLRITDAEKMVAELDL